ncbi:serine/threonine-protein kinase PknG [Micromonospora sp. NBC_01655]|uniref:serine/threonine-protein kinase n=1 Tax=Micromonospora sp. NBC_01655 TaxID=2975983 RepID=UPI00225A7F95|nr:serine/threonine-protein kinase [Micromonospora sp. NBC_01655]MCX4472923.1 serine/threonine-protein kinase PknG [Micromonospora sp. NBC_01655]
MRCPRTPGCPGAVDTDGFCTVCGLAPEPGRPATPPAFPDGPAAGEPVGDSSWTVAGLVSLPVLSFPRHGRVSPPLSVPEESRSCTRCGGRVGRGGADRLDHGYCPACGTPFAFVSALHPGDLVADQYEVVGYLAQGGLGQVYLAEDTHLDRNPVALKRLLNKTSAGALAIEVSERRFLTTLDHPNIVRIFNFVTAEDRLFGGQTSYIVMEYLAGMSLHELLLAVRLGQPGVTLSLVDILAYGHEILTALEYLHGKGLLYTDLHPGNAIRTGDRIKLIDLGGARRADDDTSPRIRTPHPYRVSDEEMATHGFTARSDLYAVGVLLEELSKPLARPLAPDPVGEESFRRLVGRAKAGWRRRFASATEMSEQLRGVLRELLRDLPADRAQEPSAVFAPTAALLDAGLGAVPPLAAWIEPATDELPHHGRPGPAAVAVGLPVPRPAAGDPATPALALIGTLDPRGLLARLAAVEAESVELHLARCRAHLELAEPGPAGQALAAARALLGEDAVADWRLTWHEGLLALTRSDVAGATRWFDEAYRELPGEVTPKLALGYCHEQQGEAEPAGRYYHAVWRRDQSAASAAFGLARLRLAEGDRAAAVRCLDEVPRVSRHYDAARIAAVRVLGTWLGTDPPEAAEVNEAVRRLDELRLDAGARHGESRDRMTAAIRQAALDLLLADGADGLAGGGTLGGEVSERSVRTLLESSLRALARQARTPNDHGVLVDRANAVRPLTGL